MIAIYAYGRLGMKFFNYLKTLLIINAERFSIPVVQAIDREDFVWLLKEDGCKSARVSLVRFNHFNSYSPEPIVYVEASAYTDAKRRVVYISSSGIYFPINSPVEKRWEVESQARAFAQFLKRHDIIVCVNNEFGCAIDPPES
ncbi:MAG: hypothetical protein G01um101491_473 [Parcubacteria group bacterium Gr01-1014_91]|nr:MAG: hypothetical protein G01um101491_473 [Parcubacteria group bacterium Gr01-1014_91]